MLYFATEKAIGPVLTHVELDRFYITDSIQGAIESRLNKKRNRSELTLNVYGITPRVDYRSSVRELEPTKALQVLHKQFMVDCTSNVSFVKNVNINTDNYGCRQKMSVDGKAKPTFAAHQYLSVLDRVHLVGKIAHAVAAYSLKERMHEIESENSLDAVLNVVISEDLTTSDSMTVMTAIVYIVHGYINADLKDMLRMIEAGFSDVELETYITLGTLEYLYNVVDNIYWPELDYVINNVTMAPDYIPSLHHKSALRKRLESVLFPECLSYGTPVSR